jgi:Flp pilus assembly protein TadB
VNPAVALATGAVCGLGVVLVADTLLRRRRGDAAARPRWRPPGTPRRWAAVGVAAVLGWVLTGWPAAGVLAAAAAIAVPALLSGAGHEKAALARMEAVAGWAELLRATMSAAAGLQQSIIATAAHAPTPIRPQVAALARRLRQGQHSEQALRRFADDLADPTGDLVTAALLLAVRRQGEQVGQLLAALAAAARAQVAMRRRVAAGQARLRTSARIITGLSLAMAAGLVMLNRQWMSPYDSSTGQLVLLTVGALFAAGLAGLSRMARLAGPPRLFPNGDGFANS